MLDAGRALDPKEIAGDWYDRVYLPTEEAIRREALGDACPDATEADLFLTVYRRRRDLFPDCGCRPLDQVAREMTADRKSPRRSWRRLLTSQAAGSLG